MFFEYESLFATTRSFSVTDTDSIELLFSNNGEGAVSIGEAKGVDKEGCLIAVDEVSRLVNRVCSVGTDAICAREPLV